MSDSKSYQNFMFVLYPDSESYSCDTKLTVVKSVFPEWAIILHDRDIGDDGAPKKPHYHCLVRFDRDHKKTIASVAALVGLPANQIQLPALSWRGSVRYLVHLDSPKKAQYDANSIDSNFSVDKYIKFVDESVKVERLFRFIMETGCCSCIELTKYALANDCWDAYRRSASIFNGILREVKNDFI